MENKWREKNIRVQAQFKSKKNNIFLNLKLNTIFRNKSIWMDHKV